MRVTESRRCASVSARRSPASSNASDRYSPRVGEMAGRAVAGEPKEIVARGYDAIALRYAEWAGKVDSPVMGWVRDLDAKLEDGADVLELGCGRGVPATRELARRHRVTGVDISAVQIELARHHVPEASFIQGDATELEVAPASVDAVVALFVFGHVPVLEQPGLIARIGLWLRYGGFVLGTMGAGIAQVSGQSGFETVGREMSTELGERGRATIERYLTRGVEKGR